MLSEFKPKVDYYDLFNKHGLMMGRMISGSKSGYRDRYPDNLVVFNANVITESAGKVWYGDLDVTLDEEKLQQIATELDETIYILYEHDARFENLNKPVKLLIKHAVQTIKP